MIELDFLLSLLDYIEWDYDFFDIKNFYFDRSVKIGEHTLQQSGYSDFDGGGSSTIELTKNGKTFTIRFLDKGARKALVDFIKAIYSDKNLSEFLELLSERVIVDKDKLETFWKTYRFSKTMNFTEEELDLIRNLCIFAVEDKITEKEEKIARLQGIIQKINKALTKENK